LTALNEVADKKKRSAALSLWIGFRNLDKRMVGEYVLFILDGRACQKECPRFQLPKLPNMVKTRQATRARGQMLEVRGHSSKARS
jgi:hypothetical protein